MERNAQKILAKSFVDSIKYATNIKNLSIKLKNILSRNFTYNISGKLGSYSGKKSMFSRIIFSRQKYYENDEKITIKNNNTIIVKYTFKKYIIIQTLFIENLKINYLSEEVLLEKTRQKGGQGYSVMVENTPIAGKPVIRSYYDCCRPVFSGGKADSGYYFDVGGNHLVVQPQYRAY
jgi:hypothetical protein